MSDEHLKLNIFYLTNVQSYHLGKWYLYPYSCSINSISILRVAQIEKYISLSALYFSYKSNQQANPAVLPLEYLQTLLFLLQALAYTGYTVKEAAQ